MDAQTLEVLIKKKVLVIQTAFLGDAVLTLPLIQQIKKADQSINVSVLCIPSTQELFQCSSSVDEVIVFDKRRSDKSLSSLIKLIKKLRSINYDVIYSPHRSLRSTFIAFFSNVGITVGYDKADFSFLYDKKIKYDSSVHEVARNLSFLDFDISNDKWKIFPRIEIPSVMEINVKQKIEAFGEKNIIAIAPGSVWQTKVYPEEYYIQLIDVLIKKGFFILLIGGKEDDLLCRRIESKFGSNIKSIAGEFSVIESIAFLKNCKALICNDSAPTHLAMVADIPALTIYCSTVHAFGFYPYNSKSRYISFDQLQCKPCGIHGHNKCPIDTFECAYKLTPLMVMEKLREIIAV